MMSAYGSSLYGSDTYGSNGGGNGGGNGMLVWDEVGEKVFQIGIDRGVLFPHDGPAVVWNGLIDMEETSAGSELKEFYLDGVKYLATLSPKEFSGKLTAFTYPDEFDAIQGIVEDSLGLTVYDQPPKSFNLSYRTRVGDDIEGVDHGYKIHILYNVIANPDLKSFQTLSGSAVDPTKFAWLLSGTPPRIQGYRPTIHIVIDSTKVPEGQLAVFEDILYGTATTGPHLLSIPEIIGLFGNSVSNPSFEIDMMDWNADYSAGTTLLDFSTSTEWSKFGTRSAHVEWQHDNTTDLKMCQIYSPWSQSGIEVVPYRKYTLSAYVNVVAPSNGGYAVLLIYWANYDGTTIGYSTVTVDDDTLDGNRIVVTGQAPRTAAKISMGFAVYSSSPDDIIEFYIDGVQFEAGEIASPYIYTDLDSNPNYVENSTFEVNINSAWAAWGATGATLTRDTTEHHSGVASLKVVTDGGAWSGCTIATVPGLVAGTHYKASLWTKVPAGIEMRIQAYTLTGGAYTEYTNLEKVDIIGTGDWQKVDLIFVAEPDIARHAIVFQQKVAGALTFYVDDIEVYKGW